MSTLAWRQNEQMQIELYIPAQDGTRIYIPDAGVVNFLVSTRQVDLYVRIQGLEERIFQANFKGLKPVGVKQSTGLTIPLEEEGPDPLGDHFAVSRSESYNDRWLTPAGWSSEQHWFVMNRAIERETYRQVEQTTIQSTTLIAEPPQSPPVTEKYPTNTPQGDLLADTRRVGGLARVFLVFTIITVLTVFLSNVIYGDKSGNAFRMVYLVTLGIFSLISFIVLVIAFLRLLNSSWQLVAGPDMKINPEMAAWLLLVPIFNAYWGFVALRGVYKEMNKTFAALNPDFERKLLSPSLPTLTCLFGINAGFWFLLSLIRYNMDSSIMVSWTLFNISSLIFLIFLLLTGLKMKVAYVKIRRQKEGVA
jgi:hypothetical protein